VALSLALTAVMLGVTLAAGSTATPALPGDFYAVIPHHVMVALFGSVFAFVLVAFAVGVWRFGRDARGGAPAAPPGPAVLARALRDVLTLRYLHGHGADCTYEGEEARTPWRRRFHHLTFYGFGLCIAATSVAAFYHLWFGWEAPYGYTSLPVVLGTAGGLGLIAGPAGLFWIGRRRDAATADPAQPPLDRALIVLLLLTSATGLVLLALRHTAAMPALLVLHLGVVLALFVAMPYGKFVHGVYRAAALARNAREARAAAPAAHAPARPKP
jgi:citrate/tricarballylate utilization protein